MINEKIVLDQYKMSIIIDVVSAIIMSIIFNWLFLLYPFFGICKYSDMEKEINRNKINSSII